MSTHWQNAWRKICFNIDGIAVGSTVAALAEKGVFDTVAASDGWLPIDAIAQRSQASRAYLHVALRLVAAQGLAQLRRDGAGQAYVRLTADGRAWLPLSSAYLRMPAILRAATQLPAVLRGTKATSAPILEILGECLAAPGGAAPDGLKERVHLHCLGPVVATTLTTLLHTQALSIGSPWVAKDLLRGDTRTSELALDLLAAQDWLVEEAKRIRVTEEGQWALQVAAQYNMAMAYLPTFGAVEHRLFPGQSLGGRKAAALDEHLDRQMDIDFSGEVFLRHCRAPLLEVTLPLFGERPFDEQPRLIVDTGCGDGSLLAEMYAAVRDRTPRGAALDEFPLVAVGADVSPVARDATARRLTAAGIQHVVVEGDIGRPEQLAADLLQQGIDMRDALHVSKSVFHNRTYRSPQDIGAAKARTPCSEAVFVAADDTLIANSSMEQNLVEHFRSWAPWTERHGMLVIEAHTVPTAFAAQYVGRSVISMLDASHGYSHQYPIEAACHRALAREAGFSTLASRDLVSVGGQPLLTMDYLMPSKAT